MCWISFSDDWDDLDVAESPLLLQAGGPQQLLCEEEEEGEGRV